MPFDSERDVPSLNRVVVVATPYQMDVFELDGRLSSLAVPRDSVTTGATLTTCSEYITLAATWQGRDVALTVRPTLARLLFT